MSNSPERRARLGAPADLRAQLAALIRQHQRDIDAFDQAVADRLCISRTDLRSMDLLLELTMAGGDVTPARLAEASGLSPSTVTSVLDRMERAGYLARVRDTHNRRQVLLKLTEQFAVVTRELFGPVGEAGMRQLAQLRDDEVATLIEFFSQSHDLAAKQTQLMREQTARQASDGDATRTRRSVGTRPEAA
jgi:DNA-binding MarR family transcriptional regulator